VINQGKFKYTVVPVEFDGALATQHVKDEDYTNVTIEFNRDVEVLAWTANWASSTRKNNELLALGFERSSLYIKMNYSGSFRTFTKTYRAGESVTLNLGPYKNGVYSIQMAFRDLGINSSSTP
jgi:hypothetical protein